jgi:hypothetical protein
MPSAALARSAVAAVEAVALPTVAAPVEPETPVAVAPVPAASPVVRRAPAPAAPVASVASPRGAAPVALPAERVAFAVDVAPTAPPVDAPAVDDVRLRRARVRPVLLIVNDPPIDCVRALGSRLCRALPKPEDDTALAEQARAELANGRDAVRNATTHIRQAEVLGGQ